MKATEKKQLLEKAAEIIRKDQIRLERKEYKLFKLSKDAENYEEKYEIIERSINRLDEKINAQVSLICKVLEVSYCEIWDEILELNK